MPLPTRTTGADLPPPECFRTINRGGCVEPRATLRNEPILSASSCLVSSTSTLSFHSFASLRASSARKDGVQMLGGRLPSRFVSAMPLAMAVPCRRPRSAPAPPECSSSTRAGPLLSSFLLLSSSLRNTVSRAAIANWRACHSASRPLTLQSVAAMAIVLTPGQPRAAARTASAYARSPKSSRLPRPTSRTRGAVTPVRPRSVTSVPRLPVMSPLATASLIAP